MKHTKQTGRIAVRWAAHGNCNTFIFFLIVTWQMAQKIDAAAAVPATPDQRGHTMVSRAAQLVLLGVIIGAALQWTVRLASEAYLPVPAELRPNVVVEHTERLADPDAVPCRDHRCGWRYDRGQSCDESSVIIQPTPSEIAAGRLAVGTLDSAVHAFRRCGVVVMKSVVSKEVVREARRFLAAKMAPYEASRSRLRMALHDEMSQELSGAREQPQSQAQLDQAYFLAADRVWERLAANALAEKEASVSSGRVFRERNDGRIDVQLPFAAPFNSTQFTFSPFSYPILAELLGLDVRLKGMHAVVALDESQGVRDQHWHRDSGLLFEPDGVASETEVHDSATGVHLPPAGINVFIPLVDLNRKNGPTEFTLGSHQWGHRWADDEDGAVDRRFYVPRGSMVIADYRTVHRGTTNRSGKPRPMLMLIYGRDWWSDAVNYGTVNIGGAASLERRYGSLEALVSELSTGSNGLDAGEERAHMFAHLARVWRQSVLRDVASTVHARQEL